MLCFDNMFTFPTLGLLQTPFYGEDVLLTRDDLEEKNSDGISTLLYLQTLYKKDWMNFLERRGE